jgi:hypothetical protein
VALDEQPPDAFSVLGPEPPQEEPLDDLAQSSLGLLHREQDRGRGWLQSVQGGPWSRVGE